MSDFTPETRPGERWWEMLSNRPHCAGTVPYKMPTWYHDYTTQIEMDKYRYYTRKVGLPLIVYHGRRYTDNQFAPMLGLKVNQLQSHMAHGAIRYKDEFRWDYDFDEYVERIKSYEAEQERKAEELEAEKERRRAEVRANFAEMNRVRSEKIRQAHQSRREAFYALFTITAREDKPGKLRILYVNGERSSKAEACKILGFGEVVLLKQLKKGNFTFNGITVEVRYSEPRKPKEDAAERKRIANRERARRRRASEPKIPRDRVAASKITWEKRKAKPKPYTVQPYPMGFVINPSTIMLTLNGSPIEKGTEFDLLGFGRQKAQKLARQGIITLENGNVLRFETGRARSPFQPCPPFLADNGKAGSGKTRWAVKISLGKGKKTTLFQSIDKDKSEKFLADIMIDEKWKSILAKKLVSC